jgi:hypothetical protein
MLSLVGTRGANIYILMIMSSLLLLKNNVLMLVITVLVYKNHIHT